MSRLLLTLVILLAPSFAMAAELAKAPAAEAATSEAPGSEKDVLKPKGIVPEHGVKPEEEVKFQQDRAEGHMRELELRMFKLARLLRETQPDDANRLMLGLEKSRDQLIADRMGETGDLLLSLKLNDASTETREIIDSLEELRRLLLSADIDLEIKLEQLRKLREARKNLAKLIEKETDQNKQTDKRDEAKEKKADDLAKSERRNKLLGETLYAKLKNLGVKCAGACKNVSEAGQKMSEAAKNLDLIKLPTASREQKDALKKLNEADVQLAKAEAEMQAELEKFVLKRVLETIDEMIAKQTAIRETTERLQARAETKDAKAMAAVRALEEREVDLIDMAEECIELGEMVNLSLVLPMAMTAVIEQVELVSDQLFDARADEIVVANMKQIEEDLAAIFDALRASSRPYGTGAGACSGCKGCRNKLLAEFKMLRFMQISLHGRTVRTDLDLEKTNAKTETRKDRIKPLTNTQREIQRMTLKLHDMSCPDCLGDGA